MGKAKAKKTQNRSSEVTKSLLLESGRKLFALHGFNGATVQDIAKKANINISMISHHFGGKEGLYRACLQGFGEARLEALEKYLETPKTAEEFNLRFEMILNELVVFHLQHPDVTAILFKDTNCQHIWDKKLATTLFGFTLKLSQFIEGAKAQKIIRKDVEPLVAAGMIYLYFSGVIQHGPEIKRVLGVSLGDPEFRKMLVKHALNIFNNGVMY